MADYFLENHNQEEFKSLVSARSDQGAVVLSGFEISDFDFPVKNIKGVHFKKTEWNKINAEGRVFINVVFEDCKLNDVNFSDSKLDNVFFKNCELKNVVMNESVMKGVVFESCVLSSTDSNIENSYRKIHSKEIIFNKSELYNLNFFESRADFVFKSVKINDVSGYGLVAGSSIVIDDSNIYDMEFSDSDLVKLVVKNSKIENSRLNDSSINTIIFENNEFKGFSVSNGEKYGSVNIKGTSNVVLGGSVVDEVYITDCKSSRDISLAEMKFKSITINNCDTFEFVSFDAVGDTMKISNMSVYKIWMEDINIKNLIFENINIDGKVNIKNAKVGRFVSKNVSISDSVEVKDEGANFKLVSD